jgi:putative transposase
MDCAEGVTVRPQGFRPCSAPPTVVGMGRLIRFDAPGALHHVFASGAGPCPIYRDAEDYASFIAITARTLAELGWTCLLYCLMTTHYHLLVRTENGDLSHGMQCINSRHARSFNARHGRRGHLFGDRFGSVFIHDHAQLQTEVRYVALNPLAAGVHPAEWPYSSYATALAGTPDPLAANDELIATFGGVDRLRAFVEDGLVRRAA